MKNYSIKYCIILLVCSWILTAQAEEDYISGGYNGISSSTRNGATINASVYDLVFEHKTSDLLTVSAGVGQLSYKASNTNNGQYEENGSGTSFFVDLNFYPKNNALAGFYIGPGIGVTISTSDWSQNINGTIITGNNSANLYDIHGKLGWKIQLDSITIDPNLRVGDFINAPSGGVNANKSLGVYLLIGVNVGILL